MLGTRFSLFITQDSLLRYSELSFDDFIRPHQHVRRNRYTDLLSRLEIDDELKLRRLLEGEYPRASRPLKILST